MLSILCVRLMIKVKVGIPESFKVGWYPLKKTGSSHLKKTSFTFMWQSVNGRVYQQISNKDVDIRGETLHFMQQQSELQRRNLWSFLTHRGTWNKITPSSLLFTSHAFDLFSNMHVPCSIAPSRVTSATTWRDCKNVHCELFTPVCHTIRP